ncbi:MAG: HU family DNA-binding protein [Elusimicrobiales bacterium]|nr:HU family DNA-binding protein [Elusimicrobiales bacterium]
MNRNHIVREVARSLADRTEAERAVRETFSAITAALKNGEKVVISGFGTFTVRLRAARQCRNPKTGETVVTGPRRTLRFKASKTLLQ